jgi:Caspase domain
MKRKLVRPVLLCTWVVILASSGAMAGVKALLLANENYVGGSLPILPGVLRETKELADRLRLMKVEVWNGRVLADLRTTEMQSAIDAFSAQLTEGDIALVYYGGHGFQRDGVNYLVPIDGRSDSPDNAVQMDVHLLRPLARSAAAARVILLDACRTPPASPAEGLAQPELAPLESLIVFATAPNRTAPNPSPFTKALIARIAEPGTPLSEIVAKVRADVLKETNNLQRPQEFGTLTKPVVLRPPVMVELQALAIDDILTVFVNGNPAVSWEREKPGMIQLPLKAGDNSFRIEIHNQRTLRLGFGPPEGWYYDMIVRVDGQDMLRLADGEDSPTKDGPRHGHTFMAAGFKLIVDEVSGVVKVKDVDKDMWKR